METKNKDWAVIPICIVVISIIMFLAGSLWNTREQLDTTRKQLTTATEELQRATDTNTELNNRLGRVSETVGELEELSSDNIGTINECLELVRSIREKVKELEASILDSDTYSFSDRCSNNSISNVEIA